MTEKQLALINEEKLNFNVINEVIDKTITSIQEGKNEIFDIVETVRKEHEQLEEELKRIKKQITDIINAVDKLEKKYHKAKVRLAEVSKNFETYTEENVKEAYDKANKLQEDLNDKRKKEKILGWAQEEERRRVAREIYDGPAQSLVNMVLRTEYCEKLIDAGEEMEALRKELSDLKAQVRENLKSVRKIIYDLRSMILDDLGLVPAIRRLIQGVEEEKKYR